MGDSANRRSGMDRRAFLKKAVIGTAVGVYAPGLLAALPVQASAPGNAGVLHSSKPPLTQQTAPTTFVQGVVSQIDGSTILLRNSRTPSQHALLSGKTSVWKEFDTSPAAIQVGDFLYVQGRQTATPDTIEALRIWANIGWAQGHVNSAEGRVLALDSGKSVYVTNRTLYFSGSSPSAPYADQVGPGQLVRAPGLILSPTELRATRIWVG